MMDNLQLRSLVTEDYHLQLSLETSEVPDPAENEVVVRIEATPINPSDLGLLFGPADMSTAEASGSADRPVIRASIPEALRAMVAPRVGNSLPCGNEGAGVVIAAGSGKAAQAMMGKTVGVIGGGMYSKYRVVRADQVLVFNEGTTPAEGASWFVNPLTVLGMLGTMRLEGHTALVHTAAASNLGQMLQKLCINEGVQLVNIVRRQEHVDLLKGIGAQYVCNSSEPDFMAQLIEALTVTRATLGFDATGGGKLAGQILTAMEAAANRYSTDRGAYGSTVHKQVYIYGGLDRSPTTFNRNFGMSWGMGGWLLTPFLGRITPEEVQRLRQKVADEIKTTFASSYTREVSLAEVLTPESIATFGRQATGEKYLINPAR
jgi:NADPH:quinone reductase